MNDQQSPSAPDPQVPQSPHQPSRSRLEPGLSDHETFALLAETMADARQPANGHNAHNGAKGHNGRSGLAGSNGHNGWSSHNGANGENGWSSHNGSNGQNGSNSQHGWTSHNDRSSGDRRDQAEGSTLGVPLPEWRSRGSARRPPGRTVDNGPGREENRRDMPPVVPFRIASLGLDDVRVDKQPSGSREPAANGRHLDWSTPVLVDEHWELVGKSDDPDPIHGHITEVIDLTQVPPVVITTDPDGLVRTVDRAIVDAEPPPVHVPLTTEDRSETTNRILPPIEESNDDEALPPLVFLNTRGDILPRFGETSNGGNGDTFDRAAAARDGGEPPVATTTSARGVEDMADPRADIEAAASTRHAVEPPGDIIEPGLNDAGDTQVLHPRATPESSIGRGVDSTIVPVDPGRRHVTMAPSFPNGVGFEFDPDPRLDELQRIFDQYSGPVIAVIASIAGDRRAIDEALQSTFEAVWKAVDTFDPEQPRGPWMFTLARRQATEQVELTRRIEQESKPGRYPVPSHRQDEAITVDKSWEAWEVRLAVDQLTQAEHDVLRLIHNEGLIHPEIASRLQTTVGAVKSHAYSGSHRLVELLDHVIRPEAADGLTVDQASALTWYLAGVADGSDIGTGERSAIKRVQGQLASATAWINPDAHARERVLSYARRTLDDPGPLVSGEHRGLSHPGVSGPVASVEPTRPEVTGRHEVVAEPSPANRRPWLIVGLSAVGLLALVAAFSLRTGSTEVEPETVRRHQMQASGADADATGVVEIATVSTGTRYTFEFGGLDASTDQFVYAAWLQSTAGGGVVPLGSFSWQAAGDSMVLSGPTWSDAYDLVVITRSPTMTRASIDDPHVLSVSIE